MREKILIVEDEPSIAENISYALSTDGFSEEVCVTGREAMERLRAGDFALIVLDDRKGFLQTESYIIAGVSQTSDRVDFEVAAYFQTRKTR